MQCTSKNGKENHMHWAERRKKKEKKAECEYTHRHTAQTHLKKSNEIRKKKNKIVETVTTTAAIRKYEANKRFHYSCNCCANW